MHSHFLGFFRLDRARSLPDPHALHANIFDGDKHVILHDDGDLRLLGHAVSAVAHAEAGEVFAASVGTITGCLTALPDGLRADDPHALLHLHAEYGEGFARHLNGHFAVVLHDRARGRLLLIQDRFPGIVTLYWLERDGLLAFSDRIEPLVRAFPAERDRLDEEALHQYLADTYITAPATIYAGVRQLPAGELLEVEASGIERRVYDGWDRPDVRLADPDEALARYRALLDEAIGDWLTRDPACGFLLSGGLDSSVNVALAAARSGRPLSTYGIAATDFHTDAPYARRVADLYGAAYTEKLVDGSEVDDLPRLAWEMENPFFEPGLMLSWNALRLASEHVDSVIGGETADQLFGACAVPSWNRYEARRRLGPLFHPWHALVRGAARLPGVRTSTFARKVENRLVGDYDPAYWCGRYGFRGCDLTGLLRAPLPEDRRYEALDLPDDALDALFDFGCTVLNRDYALYGILVANGRMGDLLGLETFSPFCDRRVADLILSLATELRCPAVPGATGAFTYKALHRRLSADLLPPDIIDRPKQGGAINPLIHLQDDERLALVRRALSASEYLGDLCRREAVAALFADVPHNATRIMQLVALDLWHHLFIERAAASPPDFTLTEFLNERAG